MAQREPLFYVRIVLKKKEEQKAQIDELKDYLSHKFSPYQIGLLTNTDGTDKQPGAMMWPREIREVLFGVEACEVSANVMCKWYDKPLSTP